MFFEESPFGLGTEEKCRVNDIMAVKETAAHLVDGIEGRARAFVQVQNGCDHRCTFCIIPFGRGNSRSVPMGEVVAQVRRLVERGYRGGGADRRRHHQLRRGPARHTKQRPRRVLVCRAGRAVCDTRQHHLTGAVLHKSHLRHDFAHRHRARVPAPIRDDAEGAAVVAAVLHLHERARAASMPSTRCAAAP